MQHECALRSDCSPLCDFQLPETRTLTYPSFTDLLFTLQPENLLLDRQGYIRIVDFGFCKYVGPSDRTYTLCGTPAYIAYEMVKGTGYTHGVD